MSGRGVRAVRVHDSPPASTADRDYWDCFRVPTDAATASPGEWASAALRGADGLFGRVVWGGLLGFDLAAGGPDDTLVGWRVVHDTADHVVLATDGSLMAAEMTFARRDGWLWWTTAVRHHSRAGVAVWAVLGPAHRRIAPRCLERAWTHARAETR